MKSPPSSPHSGALVPAGERIDHPENVKARKLRELGATFNRMSSANDIEALNAFERARDIVRETGTSFYAIWKMSRESAALQDINKKLGKQLKQALQENAKFRSMNLSYKFKGHLIQTGRIFTRSLLAITPLLIILILFLLGYLSAGNATLLMLPVGFYSASKGVLGDSPRGIGFGILVMLTGVIALSIVSDYDLPRVRQQEANLLENMNRDHELGPTTLYIDYPLSFTTRVTTVIGIHDTVKISIDGLPDAVEVSCAKYYDNAIVTRQSHAHALTPPTPPDIFHSAPVATFGLCDLYAKLSVLTDK